MRDAGDVSRCPSGTERRHPQVIATIETIMRMGASLDSEPDLISVLIQNKLHYRGSDALGWLLNHRQLTLKQLAELQQICQRAERTNSVERALVGERAVLLALFDSSAAEILTLLTQLMRIGCWPF